jgi:hypothetical protein
MKAFRLNLVNRFAVLVRDRSEVLPHKQCTSDVVALDADFATLTGFNSGQRFNSQ